MTTRPHYQSGARAKGIQRIPPLRKWTRLWFQDGTARTSTLVCKVTAPHDIDYALRILPGRGHIWYRVARVDEHGRVDLADNGTRWVGPVSLHGTEYTYDGRNIMDKQGGIAGHGYRIEVMSDRGCYVDQFYFKMDPRGE